MVEQLSTYDEIKKAADEGNRVITVYAATLRDAEGVGQLPERGL